MAKKKRWGPTETEIKLIGTMSAYGVPIERLADYFGVSKQTFELAMKKSDAMHQAILKGRAKGLSNVAQTAYEMAMSKRQPAMTIFYLKTRGGWRETQRVEHTGADGKPIETNAFVSTDQLARMAEAVLKKKKDG